MKQREKNFSNVAFKPKQLFFFFTNFSTILNKSNNVYNMSTKFKQMFGFSFVQSMHCLFFQNKYSFFLSFFMLCSTVFKFLFFFTFFFCLFSIVLSSFFLLINRSFTFFKNLISASLCLYLNIITMGSCIPIYSISNKYFHKTSMVC